MNGEAIDSWARRVLSMPGARVDVKVRERGLSVKLTLAGDAGAAQRIKVPRPG